MKTPFLIVTLLLQADTSSTGQLWTLPLPVVPVALGILVGLVLVLGGLRCAPEGYEDEEGFHLKQRCPRIRDSRRLGILSPHNAS